MTVFNIPIRTISEANNRDHWSKKARRAKGQRLMARLLTLSNLSKKLERYVVTLTRIGKRKLDTDNLARSMKAIRDGIADAIGVDDGDERLRWEYEQKIGKSYFVEVSIK